MTTAPTRQDSLFFTHRLPNGLQLLGQHMPEVASSAAVFYVNTGTRDETAQTMGVSHFLEHMAFRRSRRLTGSEIDLAFERMGAEYNAGTWLEMTFYWARVLCENTGWSVELLSDLTRPVLDEKDFDQERHVILEEIARYKDLPSHVLLASFMESYFHNNPLAWQTLGTDQTIEELTVQEMREYWRRRYGARNIIFAIAGNFDWDSIVDQVTQLSQDWEAGETGRARVPVQPASGLHVSQTDRFAQEQIAIGSPSVDQSDPRYYAAAAMATVLGDDTGSRLFWALHEKGLAETASAQVMPFEDTGVLISHIGTEPDKAVEALAVARAELQKLQEHGVEPDELERAKAKLLASVIIGGESTNERMMALVHSWLSFGRLETLEEIREKIEAVTVGDINDLLHEFPVWPAPVTTALGPLDQGDLENAG